MRLDCPTCQRSYDVDRAEIDVGGRTVICSHCSAQWFVRGELTAWRGDLPAEAVSSRIAGAPLLALAMPAATVVPRRALAAIGLVVTVATALFAGRNVVVRTFPRTAALYALAGRPVNLRGLDLDAVRSAGAAGEDVTVSGSIRNVSPHRIRLPNLRFEARSETGIALVSWRERAGARNLQPGRSLAFTSAPHRLPAAARSVLVEFEDAADTHDRVAELRR